MANLVAATIFFLAIHIGIASSPLRPLLVARLGEQAYRGLFSALSLGGLIWMVWGYNSADAVPLWSAGAAGRHLAFLLMLPAFYLVVAGLTTPNPSLAGAERRARAGDGAQGVMKLTRHPFLWGVAFWALAHLIANGHLAALIFFGGLGLLALVGSRLLDARKARTGGEAWQRFAASTSWLPCQALLQGRAALRLIELGWWRPALALALYLALLLGGHAWLIGVPLVAL
jgi:uncharacterized membrane protein